MTDKAILEKNDTAKKGKEQIANRLNGLKKEYEGKEHGDLLKILGSLIDSLAIVTTADILQKGSSPLFLSLKIALKGIESEKSKAGLIGRVLSLVIREIESIIVESGLDKNEVRNKDYIIYVIQVLVLVTIGMTQYFKKLNLAKGKDEDNLKNQIFGLELIIIMILKTKLIDFVVQDIVEGCGIKEQNQLVVAKLIKAFVVILSLLTIAGNNHQVLKSLWIDLKEYLKIHLSDIETYLELKGRSLENIYIQDALVSLQDEDFDSLYQTYVNALEGLKAKPEDVSFEIEKIITGTEIVFNAFVEGNLANRSTTSLMI